MKTFTIISMGALAAQEPCDALTLKKLGANFSAPAASTGGFPTGGCNNDVVLPCVGNAFSHPAAASGNKRMEHAGMWGDNESVLAGFPDTVDQYKTQLEQQPAAGDDNTCDRTYNRHRGIYHYKDAEEKNPFEKLARDYGLTLHSDGFQFTDPSAALQESGNALEQVRGMLRADAASCNKISYRSNGGVGPDQNHEFESALYDENSMSIMRRAAEALHKAPENPDAQLNVALTKLYAFGLMRAYGYDRWTGLARHRHGKKSDMRTAETELFDALDMIKRLPAEVSDRAQPRIAQAYLEVIEAALGNYLSLETIETGTRSPSSWRPDMLTSQGGNQQRALWLIDGLFAADGAFFPSSVSASVRNYLRLFVERKAGNEAILLSLQKDPLETSDFIAALFQEAAKLETAPSSWRVAAGMRELMVDVLDRRMYATLRSASLRPRRFRANPGVCKVTLEEPWHHCCQVSLATALKHFGHGAVEVSE